VPPGARFCPGCGDAMPDGLCPACDEPTPPSAPFCMHCGILKESWTRSSAVLELARRAFSAGDLGELSEIAERLDGDEPHAPKVRELREELAERGLFVRREEFRGRVEAALASGDRQELVRLRAEVADDPDLKKVVEDLTGREVEQRAQLQELLDDLRETLERRDEVGFTTALVQARKLVADRASWEEQLAPWEARAEGLVRDRLGWGWYAAVLAIGCVPFPLGLWLVSTVSDIQAGRWSQTHPARARSLGRLALVAGPSLAFVQVLLLATWLIGR
jgi:hypothetical protein